MLSAIHQVCISKGLPEEVKSKGRKVLQTLMGQSEYARDRYA